MAVRRAADFGAISEKPRGRKLRIIVAA